MIARRLQAQEETVARRRSEERVRELEHELERLKNVQATVETERKLYMGVPGATPGLPSKTAPMFGHSLAHPHDYYSPYADYHSRSRSKRHHGRRRRSSSSSSDSRSRSRNGRRREVKMTERELEREMRLRRLDEREAEEDLRERVRRQMEREELERAAAARKTMEAEQRMRAKIEADMAREAAEKRAKDEYEAGIKKAAVEAHVRETSRRTEAEKREKERKEADLERMFHDKLAAHNFSERQIEELRHEPKSFETPLALPAPPPNDVVLTHTKV